MKRPHVANEKGEIAIAILVSIVALISGLSMSMVAGRDANAALYQLDQVQELSLLRSDIRRGNVANSFLPSSIDNLTLPVRYVEIHNGLSRTTFAIKTKIGRAQLQGGLQVYTRRGITTLVRAFRTRSSSTSFGGSRHKSPVETFGRKTVQRQTFAGYMYLTNTDESVNNDPVYFYGYDELWGRVHSNTDIWLQNVGGWPTFHGHVSTAGEICSDGAPNPDQVFLDGYTEHAPEIDFSPSMNLIRQNGTHMWSIHPISFVTIEGASYTAQLATFDILEPDTLFVYNLYPPYGPIGDSLGYNYLALRDTTWVSAGSSIGNGATFLVESDELWIKGVCRGAMTWATEGTMKLAGDITYHHTTPGVPPDGSGSESENQRDYLGLVAAKSILIQYGYKNPVDSVRHRPNCDDYNEGIYIYGALAALGNGQGDPHQDGVFSFEYQYPHQSTPNTWYQGEYFDNIDLHLGYYPPADPPYWPWPAKGGGGYNYAAMNDPQGPDYPWYNPLWPEALPVKERGLIHLFGSVAQMRRGFVHRSGGDPLDTGWWDLDGYRYGPPPAWGLNAPGTPNGKNGVGYDKDYHYDRRFINHPPPNFPEVSIVGSQGLYEGVAIRFQRPPSSF
ncbi:MAG: hypothetical protein K8R90_08985 [Candidatus Cloacimonetes bacterium]|nr:hypothetical protein [Candidatus Cloacimonadota bacterium]